MDQNGISEDIKTEIRNELTKHFKTVDEDISSYILGK